MGKRDDFDGPGALHGAKPRSESRARGKRVDGGDRAQNRLVRHGLSFVLYLIVEENSRGDRRKRDKRLDTNTQ